MRSVFVVPTERNCHSEGSEESHLLAPRMPYRRFFTPLRSVQNDMNVRMVFVSIYGFVDMSFRG